MDNFKKKNNKNRIDKNIDTLHSLNIDYTKHIAYNQQKILSLEKEKKLSEEELYIMKSEFLNITDYYIKTGNLIETYNNIQKNNERCDDDEEIEYSNIKPYKYDEGELNDNVFTNKGELVLSSIDNNTQNNNTRKNNFFLEYDTNSQQKNVLRNNFISIINNNNSQIDESICNFCENQKFFDPVENYYICDKCGDISYMITNVSQENIKENGVPITNKKNISVKNRKKNHLINKLLQIQSREHVKIPDSLFKIVKHELVTSYKKSEYSHHVVKEILKKHKMTLYYDHAYFIYCKITGSEPIKLSKKTIDCVINMFQKARISFTKTNTTSRTNFLNYSYVFNKIFNILGETEYAKLFLLLKNNKENLNQDKIWKVICKDNGWPFKPSF